MIILDSIDADSDLVLPIYGNAFDEQYQLEILPKDYQSAANYFLITKINY